MGYGDALMASAEARQMLDRVPGVPVAIGDGNRLIGSPVFDNNPRLASAQQLADGTPVQWLHNYGHHRPYHQPTDHSHKKDKSQPWLFTGWRVRDVGPGELYFTAAELDQERESLRMIPPGPFIVIEPTVKRAASPNKQWGFENYAAVAKTLAANGVRLVQLGPSDVAFVPGVDRLITGTFRQACAILARAALYVGNEGGLHHAAAALGVPAVVIFGGFTSPWNTGYHGHVNFYADHPMSPCGERLPCDHCRICMDSIRPAAVAEAALTLLEGAIAAGM